MNERMIGKFFKSKPKVPKALPTYQDALAALKRIQGKVGPTPLSLSAGFSKLTGREVLLKWDNKLPTGSFKERGAANFLIKLLEQQPGQAVCAASAGNHALALSRYASILNLPCTIVMPKNAPLVKVEATESNGARVFLEGRNYDEASIKAREIADREKLVLVPAFDHPWIVEGQATCALELLEQDSTFDSVIIPVGGGGLAAGIALVLKEKRPDVYLLGAQSEWVTKQKKLPVEQELLVRGSIADGIAVKSIGKVPKAILDSRMDQFVSLSDDQIAEAIVKCLEVERTVVEGAGAVGLAALLFGFLPEQYRRPVILMCGSNIDAHLLARLIEREHRRKGRLFRLRVTVPDRPGSLAYCTKTIADLSANVLETHHDRSFSREPGYVDITFLLEVKDLDHRAQILQTFRERGIPLDESIQEV